MGKKQRLAAEAAEKAAAQAAALAAATLLLNPEPEKSPEPAAGYTLVIGDSKRSLSPTFKREKSPFELGEKRNLQCASAKAIIDKALIMDITGGVTNVDEYISLFFTDSCVIDRAVLSDVSSPNVKIVIIDEGDDEAMAEHLPPNVASAESKEAPQDEKKLRFKISKMTKNQQKHPIKVLLIRRLVRM
jgi:hypothetical protein